MVRRTLYVHDGSRYSDTSTWSLATVRASNEKPGLRGSTTGSGGIEPRCRVTLPFSPYLRKGKGGGIEYYKILDDLYVNNEEILPCKNTQQSRVACK